jgi:hypothetical protein
MPRITTYAAIDGETIADADQLLLHDVSDTSMSATGTTKAPTARDVSIYADIRHRRFSIEAKGAEGDGSTNDHAAIQNTIDQLDAAGGGVLVIPPCAVNYTFDQNLEFGDTPILVEGLSGLRYDETSWLRYTGAGTAITLGSTNTRFKGIRLTTLTGEVGIDTNEQIALDFEHCEITGFGTAQLLGTNSWWVDVRRCTIQGAAADGSVGILSSGNLNAWTIERNVFICTSTYNWSALDVNISGSGVASSTGSTVEKNDFAHGVAGARYAIQIRGGGYGISIVKNRVENEGLGFIRQYDNSFGLNIDRNQVAGADSAHIAVGMLIEGGDVELGPNSWIHVDDWMQKGATARDTINVRGTQSFPVDVPVNYYTGTVTGGEDSTGQAPYATRINGGLTEYVHKNTLTNLSTTPVALLSSKALVVGEAVCKLTTIAGHSGYFNLSIGREVGTGYKLTATAGANCSMSEGAEGVFTISITGDARTYTFTVIAVEGVTALTATLAASSLATGTTTFACRLVNF